MIIAICGASGSGKSELSKVLNSVGNVKEIVSYTTRASRPGEKYGQDYYFVSNDVFHTMIENGDFCEYEEYSQNRFYGTSKESILNAANSDELFSVVVTPNGMRAIEKALEENGVSKSNCLTVLVEASLGTRVKRYIDRVGSDDFNFDDMNEINARVNRDFGMFLNMEKYCDIVLDNSIDYRYVGKYIPNPLVKLAEQVLKAADYKKQSMSQDIEHDENFPEER